MITATTFPNLIIDQEIMQNHKYFITFLCFFSQNLSVFFPGLNDYCQIPVFECSLSLLDVTIGLQMANSWHF